MNQNTLTWMLKKAKMKAKSPSEFKIKYTKLIGILQGMKGGKITIF